MSDIKEVYKRLNNRDESIRERWKISRNSCDHWLKNTINDFVIPNRNKALIIGAGHCDDFSLETIVESFSQVDVIDIDKDSVLKAISRIPSNLQGKVNVYGADITGVVQSGIPILKEKLLKEGYESFINETKNFRDRIPKTFKPDVGTSLNNEYDFIFSNSITSQLFGPAFLFGVFDTDATINIFEKNIAEISNVQKSTSLRVITPYLRLLNKALKKGGVLALSSDTIEINSKNRTYLEKTIGPLFYMATKYLQDKEITEVLSQYQIIGSNADVIRIIKQKKIKLKDNMYLVTWPWNFNKEQQYINVGISYTK